MVSELKRILVTQFGGVVERHAIGKLPGGRRVAIGHALTARPSEDKGNLFKLAALKSSTPVCTTVIRFENAAKAATAFSEAFRHIGRRGFKAKIYQGHETDTNALVLNIFNRDLADKWETEIKRYRRGWALRKPLQRAKMKRI